MDKKKLQKNFLNLLPMSTTPAPQLADGILNTGGAPWPANIFVNSPPPKKKKIKNGALGDNQGHGEDDSWENLQ